MAVKSNLHFSFKLKIEKKSNTQLKNSDKLHFFILFMYIVNVTGLQVSNRPGRKNRLEIISLAPMNNE